MLTEVVKIQCVAVRKSKYDAPISVDSNGPETFAVAFQTVKPETRQVHIVYRIRRVKPGQIVAQLSDQFRRQAAWIIILEESLQPFVPERSDHDRL